jgi:hypothetical protein
MNENVNIVHHRQRNNWVVHHPSCPANRYGGDDPSVFQYEGMGGDILEVRPATPEALAKYIRTHFSHWRDIVALCVPKGRHPSGPGDMAIPPERIRVLEALTEGARIDAMAIGDATKKAGSEIPRGLDSKERKTRLRVIAAEAEAARGQLLARLVANALEGV